MMRRPVSIKESIDSWWTPRPLSEDDLMDTWLSSMTCFVNVLRCTVSIVEHLYHDDDDLTGDTIPLVANPLVHIRPANFPRWISVLGGFIVTEIEDIDSTLYFHSRPHHPLSL